jgi:hypothetical protein
MGASISALPNEIPKALDGKFDSASGNLAQKTPRGKELKLPDILLTLINPAVALLQFYICLRRYG